MSTHAAADLIHAFRKPVLQRSWERLALYLSVYALTVLLTCLLWQRPSTLALAYALISILLLARWHSRSEVAYFCLAALLGPAGEFVAVGFGAWHYSLPLLKIPVWLPLAYGISGLFLNKVAGLLILAKPRSERCGGALEVRAGVRRAAVPLPVNAYSEGLRGGDA